MVYASVLLIYSLYNSRILSRQTKQIFLAFQPWGCTRCSPLWLYAHSGDSDGVDAVGRNVNGALAVDAGRHPCSSPGSCPTSHGGGPTAAERRRLALPGRRRRRPAALAAQQRVERAPEVRVEDVVDDRVEHRAAVREPLERDEDSRRQVRPTRLAARALNDVDGEERQVAGDEHGEQDSEHLQHHTVT